ncbi:hypothetical protein [uncultured Friedmanniella sp.]|uniref:hypothetical protein n=1 Tax=uncultured Friedmanniella sp. TaxID=335381 RepID=UPI0035CAA441
MELYLGIIGVGVGSVITGLVAVSLELIRNRREAASRLLARQQAQDQLRHDQLERRYQDRQDAYLIFERAVLSVERHALAREMQGEPSPSDLGMDQEESKSVTDAVIAVELLAGRAAREAALRVVETLSGYAFDHGDASYVRFASARNDFRSAVRQDLGTEDPVTSDETVGNRLARLKRREIGSG